jgi:hypothetical protein
MKHGHKLILIIFVLIIAISSIFLMLKRDKKSANQNDENTTGDNISSESELSVGFENSVFVQTEDGNIDKIDIVKGTVEKASALERYDFSGFSGLPEDNIDNTKQSNMIVSKDKQKAIVNDLVCDIAQKKCETSNLLSQSYQGLDPNLQKENGSLWWFKWDSVKNILYGYVASDAVYVCDTQNKKCDKSVNDGASHIVIQEGTFSPSLEKFITINQHDKENIETGKSWELALYASSDLTKPLKTFDISVIISRDEIIAYDSVQSVAWSGDEKKLAIGTARRIFIFDFESGGLSLAYVAPTNEEGDFYWDSSGLFLSSDAKFIAFIDESDERVNSSLAGVADAETELDSIAVNVLKKIDLENSNKVSELFRGPGLSFQ